jgi:hypothetical protein
MNSRKRGCFVEERPPKVAGARPHGDAVSTAGRLAWVAVPALFGLGLLGAACSQGDAQTDSPVVLGLTASAPAYYSDQEITLYEAQKPVPLAIRKPTSAEVSALGKAAPYPRAPFLEASDVSIEIHYTLSNLDDAEHTVELLLDPWNEFVHWAPGVTVVNDDETVPNLSGYDNYFVVPARGRVEGTITPDDTYNMEVNLATVENVLGNPPANLSVDLTTMCNHVFNLQHRSNDGDPLVTPFIPAVIAGMTGFDLGIRTSGQANVAVEIIVDVVDNKGNRVVATGSGDATLGKPGKALSPPGARQGN